MNKRWEFAEVFCPSCGAKMLFRHSPHNDTVQYYSSVTPWSTPRWFTINTMEKTSVVCNNCSMDVVELPDVEEYA